MENASKALIIAGSILLAILIISLGMIIFTKMSAPISENANLDEQEVAAFNADISPYLGQKVSGSQVNALIQLAISIDNKALNDNDKIKRVSVYYNSSAVLELKETDTAITYGTTRRVETGGKFYKVEAKYASSGLINEINITPN